MARKRQEKEQKKEMPWTEHIPDDQWALYERVLAETKRQEIPFALGGAFAVATYTGRWRNTKDLDIYVEAKHADSMINLLSVLGLKDYYDVLPYVRHWIYRGHDGERIVDVIWAMANEHAHVDETWLSAGPEVQVHGQRVQIVPPEEMIWAKLYVLQKDRCDWPDVFNLIFSTGDELDWERLLDRLGPDWPLLSGALAVFSWLSPGKAGGLPDWLWSRLHLQRPEPEPAELVVQRRSDRLDGRPWFGPAAAED